MLPVICLGSLLLANIALAVYALYYAGYKKGYEDAIKRAREILHEVVDKENENGET